MQKIETINTLKEMEILARIPLFKHLTPQERACLITDELQFYIAEKEDYVIKQNDHDHCFYILLSGTLQVTKNANHAVIANIEPGGLVGEVGFITNQPRTAYVQAIEKSMLIRVDQQIMARLPLKMREQIKDKLIDSLVDRINYLNDEVIMLSERVESVETKTNAQSDECIQLADDWQEEN
ncbi:hypothetical protein DS2_11528 [Catenovulum agarivorans DS-2]|uniref:Cyclic nucleotide-binding domain-containing protein n=1 Tax=Catenovulum agarivorans DS-2 TaxID=1328313 RepID=W7QCG6_9ALTE|nr:cyclic nucleotide-binding domain-containing protein [Catenovulum agarivorans]EWH09596.1 hypothetical protein DS2_11528 [Catenovulum agarivorans DS-2]